MQQGGLSHPEAYISEVNLSACASFSIQAYIFLQHLLLILLEE
jgi:hypothetical protein